MADPVIRIERLGKRYRVGEWEPYGLLSETVARLIKAPARRLRGRAPRDRKDRTAESWLWALKDVSFDVAAGEIVGIVGRNGAGKSTLLKILSRITSPTEGRVEIEGRITSLLEVGTGFHPELTGRENVFLNGSILGMPRRQTAAVFEQIVDYAGIERFIDTPVKFYSSGMKVRLGFAVAAHLNSEIMIVDEVLSVGDLAFRQKSLATIEQMCGSGRTILLVTHNTATLGQLAQRCVYLDAGAVRGLGPTQEIVDLYQRDVFGAAGPPTAELPAVFHWHVADPAARLKSVTFLDAEGRPTRALSAGEPATLSFEIAAERDIEGADPRVLFFRDGAVIRSDFGHRNLGLVSLKGGERRRVEISYPAVPFGAGEITLVVFLAPHDKAQPQDAVSDFSTSRLVIEQGADTGAGLVRLPQSWRITEPDLATVARTGS